MKYIYGPVPSRRLGFSLGVDLVPYKTCPFDCIYCQLGKTTNKTVTRKEYSTKEKILRDVAETLAASQPLHCGGKGRATDKKIDYITLAGSGEPTLNSGIGWLIKEIKKITQTSIAVLTNGSLLWDKSLRQELLLADLVVPSLDAVTENVFKSINCPHQSLDINKIIKGLKEFRKEFKNTIWLEIMLVKGVNDSKEEIEKFKNLISEIRPDKVHLNTVVRPPTDKSAHPLSIEKLEEIRDFFGENCEVIAEFKREKQADFSEDIEQAIIELIKRRPVTLSDINNSLGIHRNELIKYLESSEKSNRIKKTNYEGVTYYEYK